MLTRHNLLVLILMIILGLSCFVFIALRPFARGFWPLLQHTHRKKQPLFFVIREQYDILSEGEKFAKLNSLPLNFIDNPEQNVDENAFLPAVKLSGDSKELDVDGFVNVLRRMPKGGLLNAHEFALCSVRCIISLTYYDNLWVCVNGRDGERFERMRFAATEPTVTNQSCIWKSLEVLRHEHGNREIDERIRNRLTLPEVDATNAMVAMEKHYEHAEDIERFVKDLVTYEPIWKKYHKMALHELAADGVNYVEYRTTLPELYDFNGTVHDLFYTARRLYETVYAFRSTVFLGANMIYMPKPNISLPEYEKFVKNALELRSMMPDFFAGIDLLNRQERNLQVADVLPALIDRRNGLSEGKLNLFYSLAEEEISRTKDFKNIINALSAGCQRIAHPRGLMHYPVAMHLIQNFSIALEVDATPFANLPKDTRDFLKSYAVHLFIEGYPFVLTSSYPMLKQAPLTNDFYEAYMGVAPIHPRLNVLKIFALNSLRFSAMPADEKLIIYVAWLEQWGKWFRDVNMALKAKATSAMDFF